MFDPRTRGVREDDATVAAPAVFDRSHRAHRARPAADRLVPPFRATAFRLRAGPRPSSGHRYPFGGNTRGRSVVPDLATGDRACETSGKPHRRGGASLEIVRLTRGRLNAHHRTSTSGRSSGERPAHCRSLISSTSSRDTRACAGWRARRVHWASRASRSREVHQQSTDTVLKRLKGLLSPLAVPDVGVHPAPLRRPSRSVALRDMHENETIDGFRRRGACGPRVRPALRTRRSLPHGRAGRQHRLGEWRHASIVPVPDQIRTRVVAPALVEEVACPSGGAVHTSPGNASTTRPSSLSTGPFR